VSEFLGYERPDGSVGIRNYVPIISTAPYANDTVKRAAGIVENAVPITHPLGRCQTKPDVFRTYRTLIGYATHPNSFGAVVVAPAGEEMVSVPIQLDQPQTTSRK
jgi:altronate dehydratase large subunit